MSGFSKVSNRRRTHVKAASAAFLRAKIFLHTPSKEGRNRKDGRAKAQKNRAGKERFRGEYILFLTYNIAKMILIQQYRFFYTVIVRFVMKQTNILIFLKNMLFCKQIKQAYGYDISVQKQMRAGEKL